jgi:hypothetical protein
MQQKTMALLVIVLLMSGAFIVGSFFSMLFAQPSIPASHKVIIDEMTITASGASLTPTYLSVKKTTWLLSTLQENFLKYGTYTYSLWVYTYQDDPEVYVCIWGPGTDGKTYQVELAASYARDFTVKCGSVTQNFQLSAIIAVEMP